MPPPSTTAGRISTHAIHPQQRGTQIASFLSGAAPSSTSATGRQQQQQQQAPAPDYVRANRRAIQDLAQSQQQRRRMEADAAALEREREQWKMARFRAIRSRIAAIMNEPRPVKPDPDAEPAFNPAPDSPPSLSPAPPASNHHASFLRRGALEHRVAAKGAQARLRRLSDDLGLPPKGPRPRSFSASSTVSSSSSQSSPSSSLVGGLDGAAASRGKGVLKPPVPKATDLAPLLRLPPRNHIVANRAAAVQNQHGSRRPASAEEEGPYRHEAFGRVPDYLVKRQLAQAAEAERARAARGDPNCPLGMRLLTEAERGETLAALDAQERELQRLLLRVPLRMDTPSMARRKHELEARVAEVARHRALFLRPKVYIVDDDGAGDLLEREEEEDGEMEAGAPGAVE